MQLTGAPGLGQLTYCTNIHAGETWEDVFERLAANLPQIRAALSPDQPFGIGLRLAAAASNTLAQPGEMNKFQAFLAEGGFYVFTLNGFPYGNFHGSPVKEGAYRPDWSEPPRLSYTNQLADQLAMLLPNGMYGSVSTVPCTFKPWAEDGRITAITDNLIAQTAHLVSLRERTGKTINLAIEPEPHCYLETIAESVDYFQNHLFSDAAVKTLSAHTGQSAEDAADSLRRHLGLCHDVCHAAVEFEDARVSVDALRAVGIVISKLQLSLALRVARMDAAAAEYLRPFVEPVYLHQTVQSRGGEITRFMDLPDALEAMNAAEGSEWRTHFHVPIFLEQMREFSTTQGFLREILALHKEQPISDHLEVETYTWDVLPDEYRGVPVADAIVRELNWVREQLGA